LATTHQPSWPGPAVRRTASLPLAYVPAIHVLQHVQDVDARDKRGHDELKALLHHQNGRRMSAGLDVAGALGL
jgi:hypothetical protein